MSIINNKKAMMTIVQFILALLIMIVIIFSTGPLYASTNNLWGYGDKLFSSTQPQQTGLNDENISRTSIAALIEGINRAANMESSYSENNYYEEKPAYAPISYKVTFDANVELKKDDNGHLQISNSWPKSFSDTFDQSEESYFSEEWFVFSDFKLDDSQAKYYNKFYENTKKSHPTITNEAPVQQLNPIYNFKLEAAYADGSKCIAKTYVDDTEQFSGTDLKTWSKGCILLSNCDRNGDGVPGEFPLDTINGKEDAKTVLGGPGVNMWDKVVKNGLTSRFPNGKITVDSGEGCLDSPTWLECPGMKIYYCGKYGFQSGQSNTLEDKDYFITAYGAAHSRTGIKFLRLFDEKFKGNPNSAEVISELTSAGSKEVTGTNGFALVQRDWFLLSDFYDNVIAPHVKNSQTQSSVISCTGGESVGNSLLKCNMYGCNLCNFELKQKAVDQGRAWIYANLDPEYLIYYQAFSPIYETAWASSGLTSLSPSPLKIGPIYQEKSAQQIADEIKNKFQKMFDFNNETLINEKIMNNYEGSGALLYAVFDRSDAFLHSADQTIAKNIFDKASKVSDILVADPSTNRLEEFMKKSNYKEHISFVKSNPQMSFPTISAFSVFFVIRDEMNKKFYSQGDEIVIKQPYSNPTISSQFLTDNSKLSNEVNNYYLQLGKDGAAQRFYLASPCKANLKIIKTKCECFIPGDNENFTIYEDGGNLLPDLTTSVEGTDYSRAITYCINPKSVSAEERANPMNSVKTVDCIEIDPIMDSTTKNFCYNAGLNLDGWWWPNYNFVSQ